MPGPFLQVHDIWESRSGPRRHCYTNRTVQNFLVMVRTKPWFCFYSRPGARNWQDWSFRWQEFGKYHRQKYRTFCLGFLDRGIHESFHKWNDSCLLLLYKIRQQQIVSVLYQDCLPQVQTLKNPEEWNSISDSLQLEKYWQTPSSPNNEDPATGEKLTEKNKKFELRKVLEMPWVFWCVMCFSLFQTSTVRCILSPRSNSKLTWQAIVFSQNATELAEQRFKTSSITAGWYTSVLQYGGFFFVPLVGVFIDVLGNRITVSKCIATLQHIPSLTHDSGHLWYWCFPVNVSCQLVYIREWNSSILWHLCRRLLSRSHLHHWQYPYINVASVCLWICIRYQDHHEQFHEHHRARRHRRDPRRRQQLLRPCHSRVCRSRCSFGSRLDCFVHWFISFSRPGQTAMDSQAETRKGPHYQREEWTISQWEWCKKSYNLKVVLLGFGRPRTGRMVRVLLGSCNRK